MTNAVEKIFYLKNLCSHYLHSEAKNIDIFLQGDTVGQTFYNQFNSGYVYVICH